MIESLHSPHVARVKALIGSRGKKERKETRLFVAEGLQFLREAVKKDVIPLIETLYLTTSARLKLASEGIDIHYLNAVDVSDAVMEAMGETVTPQGIIGICQIPDLTLGNAVFEPGSKYIYLHEIQDPGNAGTILRTADATGFSGVIASANSVDLFSPKVVRASAGSLWHLPVYEKVDLVELLNRWPNKSIFALEADAEKSLLTIEEAESSLWIFGNEAHGFSDLPFDDRITPVSIPMEGNAESLNLAAAAAMVMFYVTQLSNSGQ